MTGSTRDVAILAMHGAVPYDLVIPCDLFGRVQLDDGTPGYRVRVCAEAPEIRAVAFNIRAPWTLDHVGDADMVIIPGIEDPVLPVPDAIVRVIRNAARRGARIASICSGAFVLAATGLLDGQRATTHWLAASMLKARYPAVLVDPDVLFVDNGQFITSAGASAGLDMCLHLVRRDYGQAVAARAARLAVAALEREGGQAQFIHHEAPVSTSSLAPLLQWMQRNVKRPLTLDQLASKASMSPRTLSRRFKEQTGTTPLQWLLDVRVRKAQALLETTKLSVEEVSTAVGFDGPSTFRARFRRTVGVSPNAYRRTFRGG
ncbi:MAG TPA: helix-turn-helix domain-containing protein [Polyangiaceae bacterium]|jgi:transcriptional regulator GlxA family with amidase domain|nr:helix-turn-helix domain-containing protein [Polyangiaceae bacterium]